MSVKRMREAMRSALAECAEKTTKVEQALQKAETGERALERLTRRHNADYEELAERMNTGVRHTTHFADSSIYDSNALVAVTTSNCKRLAESLQAAIARNDVAERRTSYGLYERWRRRLDLHLCAGGHIEQSNTMEFLDASRGYKPSEEVKQLRQEEEAARKRNLLVDTEIDDARRRVRFLKHEVFNAENERGKFTTEVEMQKRRHNEWWQEHLSQLPDYCALQDAIRNTEGHIAGMRIQVEQGRIECAEMSCMEAAADADLENARLEHQAHEQQIYRVRNFEEATLHSTRGLEHQAEWQPDEVTRLERVRSTGRQLEEVQQFHQMCALESEEARKTQARCSLERQNLDFAFTRAQEDLLTVQRHIELLRGQRKVTMRLLMERAEARQELLETHMEVALEHERQKVALEARGIVADFGQSHGRSRGRSLSQQPQPERYASSVFSAAGTADAASFREARSSSPMPVRRQRRAL